MSQSFAARARDDVADLIHRQAPRTSGRVIDDALLVVSELVTNAVRHGGGIAAFAPIIRGNRLVLHVADHSEQQPVSPDRTPEWPAEGGYGWSIVRNLADSVNVSRRPQGGKDICVALSLLGHGGTKAAEMSGL
ncbi:ATP-binding protein [Streptomyces sp. ICC1]|nr:ATP-binding protein [Streptomyces sp. ICC4]AWZ17698.1 ATP-binding protein [Streptomyces sp. ICC1]